MHDDAERQSARPPTTLENASTLPVASGWNTGSGTRPPDIEEHLPGSALVEAPRYQFQRQTHAIVADAV